ncbi:hypothetical protein [Wukongibacter baidiensis]
MAKQFSRTVEFTMEELECAKDAMYLIKKSAEPQSKFESIFSAYAGVASTVLGLFFLAPTTVAIGSAALAVLSVLTSEDYSMKNYAERGYDDLSDLESYARLGKIEAFKIKVAYIEYDEANAGFITDAKESWITAIYKNGRWHEVA